MYSKEEVVELFNEFVNRSYVGNLQSGVNNFLKEKGLIEDKKEEKCEKLCCDKGLVAVFQKECSCRRYDRMFGNTIYCCKICRPNLYDDEITINGETYIKK